MVSMDRVVNSYFPDFNQDKGQNAVEKVSEKFRALFSFFFAGNHEADALEQLAIMVKIRKVMFYEALELNMSEIDARVNLIENIKTLVNWITTMQLEQAESEE